MEKIITIPEERTIEVQKADVERSARRDIIVYLMEHPEINVDENRRAEYQKEYDEKYFAFEQAKSRIERDFVMPATDGKASSWNLNYSTNEITITLS